MTFFQEKFNLNTNNIPDTNTKRSETTIDAVFHDILKNLNQEYFNYHKSIVSSVPVQIFPDDNKQIYEPNLISFQIFS